MAAPPNISSAPIRSPIGQRLGRFLRRQAPLVVWLAAVAGVGWMMIEPSGPIELEAIAEPLIRQIAAVEAGRLAAVAVAPMEAVRSGQVIAMIEDASVAAEIATAQAEIARLRAAIGAEGVKLAQDTSAAAVSRLDDQRRFESDAESYRSSILELKTTMSSDRVRVERLKLEMERLGRLRGENIVSQQDYDNIRLEHDEVARQIEENERVLKQNEDNLAASLVRLSQYKLANPAAPGELETNLALDPLRLALQVQERRIEELVVQRQSLVLRSPVDGWVTQVFRSGGEAVRPGEPIASVTSELPGRLVAYIDEAKAPRIAVGSEVTMTRRTNPPEAARTSVIQVGPAIEPMPERFWRLPNMPRFGRPVVLAGAGAWKLLPGEVVGIRLDPAPARSE